ncbi:hypothetical protein CRUP_026445 [Coryphaenoides rupestris]|nr:hypothetical protein CRUP_026445 [Coryphaenoides rupestris]
MYKKFKCPDPPSPSMGRGKDWNVDLIPKFFLADGALIQLLVHTGVTRYLDFKVIEGSYIYKAGKLHTVPATEEEALSSDLLGMFDKRRFRKLLQFILNFDSSDCRTHQDINPHRTTTRDLFQHFDLGPEVMEVTGHAVALHHSEDYLDQPCAESIKRMRLYLESIARYKSSPFLYPLNGLGELPQGFARLSAEHGGTYIVNRVVDEIVMENGKVAAVKSQGDVHVFISMVSCSHNVASEGMYIATVSTTIETSNPEKEVQPALELLQPILQKQIFVCRSYDGTTHFETECEDIKNLYHRITGAEFCFPESHREPLQDL